MWKLTRKIEYNILYYFILDFNNIPSEFKSFKLISIKVTQSYYELIKTILEENAGNIDGPKEAKRRFASNETVLIVNAAAVADMEKTAAVAKSNPIHICFLLDNLGIMSSLT